MLSVRRSYPTVVYRQCRVAKPMKKHHQTQQNLDRVVRILRQFPHGIRIIDLAEKVGVKRTTIYGYLKSLEMRGETSFQRGTAYPSKPESGSPTSSLSSSVPLQKRIATIQGPMSLGETLKAMSQAKKLGYDLEIQQQKKGFIEKLKDLLDYKISVP